MGIIDEERQIYRKFTYFVSGIYNNQSQSEAFIHADIGLLEGEDLFKRIWESDFYLF